MNICFTKPTCGSKLPRKARETSGSTGRRKGLLRVIGQWICHETFCPNLQHKVILNPACAFFGKPCAGGRSILAGPPTGIGFHASLGSQALYHVAVTRRLCRRLKMIGSLEPAQVPKDTRRLKKYPALKKKRKHSTDHTMVYAYCGSKTIDQPTKMCPGLALCVQTHEKHLGCTLFCHLLLPRLSKVSV